jgi:hypothetical protein
MNNMEREAPLGKRKKAVAEEVCPFSYPTDPKANLSLGIPKSPSDFQKPLIKRFLHF